MKVSRRVLELLVERIDLNDLKRVMSGWKVSVRDVKSKRDAVKVMLKAGLSPVRLEELLALADFTEKLPFTYWRIYRFPPLERITPGILEKRLNRILSRVKEETCYFRVLRVEKGLLYVFYRYRRDDGLVKGWVGIRAEQFTDHVKCLVKSNGLLLVEEAGRAEMVVKMISDALGVSIEPLMIPPFILRELAEEGKVKRAVVLLDGQITGVKGLSRVVLEGDDILKGVEKLRSRQELNFWAAGPLLEIETDEFNVSSEGRISLRKADGTAAMKQLLQLAEKLAEKTCKP